jgi:Spy/CpxP family protein refolding chaperone
VKRYAVLISIIIFFVLGSFLPALSQEKTPQDQTAQDQPERRPAMRHQRGFFPELEESLNLTPEQKTKLADFRKARREERTASFEQMSQLRTDLRELMKDPQANEKKIDGLIDEMSQLRASQMKSAIKSSVEMNKIFTPEQLEKMKDFRTRMGSRLGMRRGRDGWRGWRMRPHRGFGWGLNPMSRWLWDW